MAREPSTPFHLPVMVSEITAVFEPVPPGVLIDATIGGGGHARALLAAHPHLDVVGLDQDRDALTAAAGALAAFGSRVMLRHARFDRLAEVVADLDITTVVGVLFDLGVSSAQLDRPDRGFSYRAAGPLDMRMNQDREALGARTAADVVNTTAVADLARMLRELGDERFADRIARAIVVARPLHSTDELAEIVRAAIPAATRRRGGHPAKRTFQALRIEVNGELDILADALDQAIDILVPGGRIAVLAYHSGEDRIVKDRLRVAASTGATPPPGLPVEPEDLGAAPRLRLLGRGVTKPGPEELAANRRAESARLRAAEKLDDRRPPHRGGTPGEVAA
jgi:16S rRNA (cytosine1402-N4)-methyltransferase